MTLIEFAERFRKLLLEAEKAGHNVDNIGETADAVLGASWDSPIIPEMIPDHIEDEA